MISLVIPVLRIGDYCKNLISNINSLYPNIELIVEENPDATLGVNYNNAVQKATGEKIILLHDDMVLKPGFVELMDKYIVKNRIVTYTRVEPPIYRDLYPGKELLDCGSNLESFNLNKFISYRMDDHLQEGGSQLFFGCMKEDYIGIDGNTFKMFCEDDDIHLRYDLGGFERKVCSAQVYHFVSKTSRKGNFQPIEFNSNKNFIRKWGFRHSIHNKKYNVAFVIDNATLESIKVLEPWCDRLYADNIFNYIDLEQPNTSFDLSKRVFYIKDNDPELENDIVVSFDASKLTQESFNIIQNLSDIITESGEPGEFELGIFNIKITSLISYEKDLIYLK